MRSPFDSYVPQDHEPPLGPPGRDGERLAWLRWVPMALISALTVVVTYQAIELGMVNRRVAQLYDRLELLDQNKMMDRSSALEAQQILILKRLQVLETVVRDQELDRKATSEADNPPAALQAPPPPR